MMVSAESQRRIHEGLTMKRFEYPVRIRSTEKGGYIVSCRDLPRLTAKAQSEQDALGQASEAMGEVFATYLIEAMDLPPPSKAKRREHLVSAPAATVVKAALHVAMRQARISKVKLAVKLGVDEKEVRRLLDPRYASKLPRIAQAIGQLGHRLVIGVEPV
jgi:antitoxin HicB